MSEVRRFAAAGLEEAVRRGRRRGGLVIGAIDETGQQKTEDAAGVKRQYMGCAGRVTNGTNGCTCPTSGRDPGMRWPARGSGHRVSRSRTR